MGVKTKKGKGRLDKFYHLAKEQGYRSRAAFKLIQLNRKFNFLSNCRALLDLCAAPGGWLQVAAKNMPMASLILGVDLVPIKPIRGAKTLIGDITTQATRAALKKEARGNQFDVVVHDGAPNVGGAWSNAAYTQAALVLDSLKLATEFLVPKGTFITKVFRSKDYNALLYAFNQLFDKVESTKPTASRNTSAEIFVVCQGFKAPAKVDPRLLDPRHLFQEITEVSRVMGPDALMRQKIKQRRHREGYDEGLSTSHRTASALEFIASSTPVELLGKVTTFALDGSTSWKPVEGLEEADLKELADKVRQHPATGAEVRALCGDLQVLGRTEFKALLKWRLALRKALKTELNGVGEDKAKGAKKAKGAPDAAKKDPAAAEGEAAAPLDPEAALLAEMEALKDAAGRREHKEKKKAREAKKKARIRAAQLGAAQTEIEENGPDGMFTLRTVNGGASALERVAETAALGDREMEMLEATDSSDDDYLVGGRAPGTGSDGDSDDEQAALRYEMQMDEALESSYKMYLERKGHRDDVVKEKRRRLGMDLELDDGGEASEEDSEEGDSEEDEGMKSDDESDGSEGGVRGAAPVAQRQRGKRAREAKDAAEAGAGGGLLVELDERRAGVATSGPAMAAQWFGQDLFNDPNLMVEEDGEEDEEDEEEEEDDQGDMSDGYARQQSHAAAGPRQGGTEANGKSKTAAKATGTAADGTAAGSDDDDADRKRRKGKGPGFEVVPATKDKLRGGKKRAPGDSSDSGTDSEDEFDLLDDQGKAEVLALAKRMLRRKDKESIVDAAYNRYAFHDTGLPRWFTEDERRHMRPILPVTKEEVQAEKERLKAVDARPIKKVAEAKGRAKRRVQAKLSAAREKAESIAAQEDVPMNSKIREIEKLYAKARAAGKRGKGKGGKDGKRGKGRKGPPLDKRMLKDKRAAKAIEKRGGRKGAKGGKGRKGK